MSFRAIAAAAGALRDPILSIPDAPEWAQFIIDAGQDPERIALHNLGHTRKRCEGEGCPLCEVGVALRVSWVAKVDVETFNGVMSPRSLWLSKRDLGSLAAQLPESGTVWVRASREPDPNGATNPKTGEPYTVKIFQAVTEDEENGISDAA